MSWEAAFNLADQLVKKLPKDGPNQSSNDEKLQFYGLFKQATTGDCTGPRPGMMDFTGKYKYDAWKKLEGMSKEDAQKKYVELLESKLKAADDDEYKKDLAELQAAKPSA